MHQFERKKRKALHHRTCFDENIQSSLLSPETYSQELVAMGGGGSLDSFLPHFLSNNLFPPPLFPFRLFGGLIRLF